MKHWLTLYQSGTSGTWLAWFINQHSGFPQYPLTPQHTGKHQYTDVSCHGADWYIRPLSDMPVGLTDFSYDTYLTTTVPLYSQNPNAVKNCCKVIPDHDLAERWLETDDTDGYKQTVKELLTPFECVIMPYVTVDGAMFEEYVKRFVVLRQDRWGTTYKDAHHHFAEVDKKVNGDKYYSFITEFATVVPIDIGKLLSGDPTEYQKLLITIDEPALPNWQDIVSEYREKYFIRNW